MSTAADDSVLVDLATFRPEGPCVLFVRPKRALAPDEVTAIMQSLWPLNRGGVSTWLVAHDLELMALGDAELAHYGLARIPLPEHGG